MTATTKSAQDCEFDELLREAWERCSDDADLRASVAYQCARQLLCEVMRSGTRGPAELERLKCTVDSLRARDYGQLCRAQPCPGSAAAAVVPRPARRPLSPRAAAECAIRAALSAYDARAGLPVFYGRVAALTCDRGARLRAVTDAALAEFRTMAHAMVADRVTRTGAALGRERTAAGARFHALARRAINRAQLAVAHVRDAMPAFDWRRYAAEPGYMRLVAVRPSPGCVTRADGTDDADGARSKRLLYQLDWLRSEVDRAEAESRCLYEQHTGLAAELAAVNERTGREQAEAADRTRRLSRELDDLRARSAAQVCAVDRLMVAVQAAQSARDADAAASPGGGGPCAPADGVVAHADDDVAGGGVGL